MKIDILTVGKIKEKFYSDAVSEYAKRLSRYAKLEIIEVKDEKTPDNATSHEEELILEKEGERLLKYIDDDAFLIPLCIEGEEKTSPELSKTLVQIENSGKSHIQFIIGGSLGISKEIKEKGNLKLSFSRMTFPHQLMRVILLEQIYRAYRIKAGEPYHK